MRRYVLGLFGLGLGVALIGALTTASRAADDEDLKAAEKILADAKVQADGPSLLAFFRQRTLSEPDRKKLAGIVLKLGDDEFDLRLKAFRELQAAGGSARPFLM